MFDELPLAPRIKAYSAKSTCDLALSLPPYLHPAGVSIVLAVSAISGALGAVCCCLYPPCLLGFPPLECPFPHPLLRLPCQLPDAAQETQAPVWCHLGIFELQGAENTS